MRSAECACSFTQGRKHSKRAHIDGGVDGGLNQIFEALDAVAQALLGENEGAKRIVRHALDACDERAQRKSKARAAPASQASNERRDQEIKRTHDRLGFVQAGLGDDGRASIERLALATARYALAAIGALDARILLHLAFGICLAPRRAQQPALTVVALDWLRAHAVYRNDRQKQHDPAHAKDVFVVVVLLLLLRDLRRERIRKTNRAGNACAGRLSDKLLWRHGDDAGSLGLAGGLLMRRSRRRASAIHTAKRRLWCVFVRAPSVVRADCERNDAVLKGSTNGVSTLVVQWATNTTGTDVTLRLELNGRVSVVVRCGGCVHQRIQPLVAVALSL